MKLKALYISINILDLFDEGFFIGSLYKTKHIILILFYSVSFFLFLFFRATLSCTMYIYMCVCVFFSYIHIYFSAFYKDLILKSFFSVQRNDTAQISHLSGEEGQK